MKKNCGTCKHLKCSDKYRKCNIEPAEKRSACLGSQGLYPHWEPLNKDVVVENKQSAYELLNEAVNTLKERGKDRDDGEERSMAKTVNLFNLLEGTNLNETQGWRFMVLLKMVRQQNSNNKCRDSFVDHIGYAGLMAESAMKEK